MGPDGEEGSSSGRLDEGRTAEVGEADIMPDARYQHSGKYWGSWYVWPDEFSLIGFLLCTPIFSEGKLAGVGARKVKGWGRIGR